MLGKRKQDYPNSIPGLSQASHVINVFGGVQVQLAFFQHISALLLILFLIIRMYFWRNYFLHFTFVSMFETDSFYFFLSMAMKLHFVVHSDCSFIIISS